MSTSRSIALALALLVGGAIVQALLASTALSQRLARQLRMLHLSLGPTRLPITYSQGAAPSAIWGGQVLMRCGPAFGIDGAQNLDGAWQNRVVLDGVEGQQQGLLRWMQGLAQAMP